MASKTNKKAEQKQKMVRIVALERRVSELEEQMHNHYGTTVPKEDIEDDADL